MAGLAESSVPEWYRGNIDINNRKVLRTEYPPYRQGSTIKTEESITIGENGNFVNIPTVIGGKRVSPREAVEHYRKTGKHLGQFSGVPFEKGTPSYNNQGLAISSWQGKNLSNRQNNYYRGRN